MLLPFPDSEDHDSLQRNGVTHILSIHNSAKPVLEVSARVGGFCGATPEGLRTGRVQLGHTHSVLLAWGREAMLGLH